MHEMLQKTQVQQSNTSVQCIYIEKECKVAQWNEKKCSVSMFHRRTFKPSGREKGTLLTSACPVSTWLCLTQRKIKLLLGVCVWSRVRNVWEEGYKKMKRALTPSPTRSCFGNAMRSLAARCWQVENQKFQLHQGLCETSTSHDPAVDH